MSNNQQVLLLNGPNLNLLGTREPQHYGTLTLDRIVSDAQAKADSLGLSLTHVQANAEHQLIEAIHNSDADFIVINPAAYTHTSVALRDALTGVGIPFIEVHLSNVHAREPFRQHSYFSDKAVGVICGLGAQGYQFALVAAAQYLQSANNQQD
ncbi:type II 3-dehydroquinate dehydratase [Paraferrimonas haliotis]|uniref:3-dehydroquinate dehydratase n=1 Tax=Paraferrimonas haliotis TaxID=2013866 RepID=A0AA37TXY6_9GAMM|nr:type II 3-dehydroquinate dehydratase [Paraferrimonas haliotis]GLS83411.1 3-dehydroquinate dehydratase [Paraferrimonas haliotis]